MMKKKLLLLTFATAALGSAQWKVPNAAALKDKLTKKDAPTATVPSDQPADKTTAAVTANPTNVTLPPPGPVTGQMGNQPIEMTLCEKPQKEPNTRWDVMCAKPSRTFEYKGSVTNFFATFRFTPALTNESVRLKVIVYKNDVMDEYREITFQTGGRTAAISMTKGPGLYTVKVVDQYNDEKVALTDRFIVNADTVGDRAVGNIKSGIGTLKVCSEIDDNWKCVNEATTWSAGKSFNLYVKLPQPCGGIVAGWSIFKQLPDGTDGGFVDDMLQGQMSAKTSYWATTNGNRLQPGTYTIYAIDWHNRTSIGNTKEFFAKTTLVVK